jgi:Holliday junction resolvasome RuvABC endonuclease subunit
MTLSSVRNIRREKMRKAISEMQSKEMEVLRNYMKKNPRYMSSFLAIDPASLSTSDLGYAMFQHGKIVESGTIPKQLRMTLGHRLGLLATKLTLLVNRFRPHLVIVERIRGRMSPRELYMATGVIFAICEDIDIIEMPIYAHKSYAKDHGIAKTDENDAISIGLTLIQIAGELV